MFRTRCQISLHQAKSGHRVLSTSTLGTRPLWHHTTERVFRIGRTTTTTHRSKRSGCLRSFYIPLLSSPTFWRTINVFLQERIQFHDQRISNTCQHCPTSTGIYVPGTESSFYANQDDPLSRNRLSTYLCAAVHNRMWEIPCPRPSTQRLYQLWSPTPQPPRDQEDH